MLDDAKKHIEFTKPPKILFMKLITFKFSIALGAAFSIGFFICSMIFLIGGHDFSLNTMNLIFHEIDFKPLMTNNGFDMGRLLCGMGILFIAGMFIGYITAVFYNLIGSKQIIKNKSAS